MSEWGDPFDDFGREVAGVNVTDRKMIGYPPIWRALNILCEHFAKIKPELHRQADREAEIKHPVRKMLRKKPNGTMSGFMWRRTSAFHLKFYGNAYSKLERDQYGVPIALTILDPSETIPFFLESGELVYRTWVDGQQAFVMAEDMHHVAGLSVDGVTGLCLAELMAPYLGGFLAAVEWFNKYFENGTAATGILMIPGHLRKEAVTNAIRAWNETAAGVANRGKVGVTQDGVKYQPLSNDAEQAQLLPVMEFGLIEAALMIGVPPHKVGSDRNTSYSSLEEQDQAMLDDSLDPILCGFEDEHDRKLLSEAEQDRLYFEYNRDGLVRASLEKRNGSYAAGRTGGWLTRNDILRAENRPTLPPAVGDTYSVQVNTVEVDKDGKIVIGTANTLPDGAQVTDPAAANNSTRALLADRLARVRKIEVSKLRKLVGRGEKGFAEAVESHYDDVYRLACLAWEEIRSVSGQPIEVIEPLERFVEGRKRLIFAAATAGEAGFSASVEAVLQGFEGENLAETVDRLLEGAKS